MGVDLLQGGEGLGLGVAEAFANGGLSQHQVLARAALEIKRAFAKLLHATAQYERDGGRVPTVVDEALEIEPAAGGGRSEDADDQQKTGEQA